MNRTRKIVVSLLFAAAVIASGSGPASARIRTRSAEETCSVYPKGSPAWQQCMDSQPTPA